MKSQSITKLNHAAALRCAAAIVSVVCLWAVLPTTEASAQACVPECRTGYTCHRGECVSLCNPGCGEGEACNAAGECIAVAPTYSAAPEPQRSAHLDDTGKPRVAVPATFAALGGFLLIAGGVTFGSAEYDYFGYWTGGHYAGLGLMSLGAVSLIAATPFLAIRTREKREWERSTKVKSLSLAPNVSPTGPSREYGLTLRGKF